MPQLSLLLHVANPLSLSLNNFNLDSSHGLVSAKQPVLGFSGHLASHTEVKKNEEAKGVLHCMWFSIPSSCATFKQTRQSLALTLCAVSVAQKVTSELPRLFCMQLKASQISWLPKAPRAPTLIYFRVGFLIVLGFFLFRNIFPYSFNFPFYGAIIYFISQVYREPAFFVVRLLWIYISWVLTAVSAV